VLVCKAFAAPGAQTIVLLPNRKVRQFHAGRDLQDNRAILAESILIVWVRDIM
jgi:hypothetical protein